MILSAKLKMELSMLFYAFQVGDIGSGIEVRHGMTDTPANILLLLDKKINIHFETLLFCII